MLAAAVRDHERVRFAYTARDRAGSSREAEPHSLVNAGRRWYLVAFDCGREDWRTFRVDRIDGPASTGARFHPRELPAKDAAAYVSRSLQSYPSRYEARVTVSARPPTCRAGAGSAATSRRSASTAASCARPTTASTGWRCGSR